jgi:hypothetical protein
MLHSRFWLGGLAAALVIAAGPRAWASDPELSGMEAEVLSIEGDEGALPNGSDVASSDPSSIRSTLASIRPGDLTPSQQRKYKRIVMLLGRAQRLSVKPFSRVRLRRIAGILMRVHRIAVRMALDQTLAVEAAPAYVSNRSAGSVSEGTGIGSGEPLASGAGLGR